MKKLFLLLSCAVMLCGCTKSNIVAPEGVKEPDLSIKEGIQIDWEQVQSGLDQEYVKSTAYPFGQQIEFYLDEEIEADRAVYLMVTVDDGTSKDEAAAYATAMIKSFNDEVAEQDFSYEKSSEQSYGGFFEDHAAWIQIMPAGTKEDEATWLVDDTILATLYREILPNQPEEAITEKAATEKAETAKTETAKTETAKTETAKTGTAKTETAAQ